MFLQRLDEYGDRLPDLPPPMYQPVAVRYLLRLDTDGHPRGMIIDRYNSQGKKNKRGPTMVTPHLIRTSGVKAKLIVDTGEYVFGITRSASSPTRVQEEHRQYMDLLQQCMEQTQNADVRAIICCLMEFRDEVAFPEGFDPRENVAFQVEDRIPIDAPEIQAFWAKVAAVGDRENLMQCLVCGQLRPQVKNLAIMIKGIPGGQTSGMALISANADAFESYGLNSSLIAPTCEECGWRFGNALNRLLSDEATHLHMPPVAYIFWSKEETGFSLVSLLSDAKSGDVKLFLETPWRGKMTATGMDVSPFYAAVLSASGARVVVRDWLETTLEEAQTNLQHYFRLQRLVGIDGEDHYLPLRVLARATINAKSRVEEPDARIVEALLHVAMHGGRLPDDVLFQVVRRLRAGGEVTTAHAALIKMVLCSISERIDDMAELELGNQDPAYLCGRLLAVLEQIQYAAMGDVGSTIVDKYYGTASSAPASIFGTLIRGAQPHLSKLHRDKPGAFNRLDDQLQSILIGLKAGFPHTLKLQDQGLFALGYYNQKLADAGARYAAAQIKKHGISPENGAGDTH
jgi:CRISPR-associated protein Csd1